MKRVLVLFVFVGCASFSAQVKSIKEISPALQATQQTAKATPREKLIAAALEQVTVTTEYDPAYVKLAYPNGDVPLKTGVCADVIVRAFRQVELDLQTALHEDMKRNFAKYPQKWGAKAPDTNIDQRRVPNLMTWFERQGKALPLSKAEKDYWPGDVVAWDLGSGLTHVGIVSDIKADRQYKIVHNIGSGAQVEDRLFEWKVIGHYRYFASSLTATPDLGISAAPEINIGTIKKKDLPHECGCSLWNPKDYVRANWDANRKVVFFSELTDYGLINIDGQDVRLQFVEASPPPAKAKVGQPSWQKFKAERLEVRIDFVATKVCGARDESCERTHYNATITATRGRQTNLVKTKGFCGC